MKQPGPYQSVLNAYLAEIAQLRETRPQPTPYRTIAKILKEKYGLEVSANSIWSFVRARTLGRYRKLKYKIAPDLVQPADPAQRKERSREGTMANWDGAVEPKRMNEDDHLHKGSWTYYYT